MVLEGEDPVFFSFVLDVGLMKSLADSTEFQVLVFGGALETVYFWEEGGREGGREGRTERVGRGWMSGCVY